KYHFRRLGGADIVAERLRHFVDAVEPFKDRDSGDDLWRVSGSLPNLTPEQHAQFLWLASHFRAPSSRRRMVRLASRIWKLMHEDGLAGFVTVMEIVALEKAAHGVFRAQRDDVLETHGLEPLAVETDFGLLRIQNFEDLRTVGLRVLFNRLTRHRRASGVAAGRVADQARHVADQEDHRVPKILKVLHLAQQDSMAQMQIGRGRIESGLHAHGPAGLLRFDEALA